MRQLKTDPGGLKTPEKTRDPLTRLIARACQGDVAAFERVAAQYYREVYGFAMSFMPDPAEAADVAQETLIKAFRSIAGYQYRSSFRTWLLQIARNTFYDRARKEKQHAKKLMRYRDQVVRPPVADPERQMMRRETADLVYGALRRIPKEYREAVVLFDLHGLSYREIADVCAVPVGTVKSRLGRGREALRATLRAEGAFDHGVAGSVPPEDKDRQPVSEKRSAVEHRGPGGVGQGS